MEIYKWIRSGFVKLKNKNSQNNLKKNRADNKKFQDINEKLYLHNLPINNPMDSLQLTVSRRKKK